MLKLDVKIKFNFGFTEFSVNQDVVLYSVFYLKNELLKEIIYIEFI